jgi:lambda repressor-like predicted transcriptional regulator
MSARLRAGCRSCGGPKPAGRGRQKCDNCDRIILMPRDVQDEVIRLYVDERLSLREVGERLYWSLNAVRNVLMFRGVRVRSRGESLRLSSHNPRRLTQDELDRTAELYLSGLSLAQVAERLGLALDTIRRRLVRAGVTIRTPAEGLELRRYYEVAHGGLTELQARMLRLVEAQPGLTTSAAARHLSLSDTTSSKSTLDKLRRMRLVSGRRAGLGAGGGRPCRWYRTRLPVRDVLLRAIEPRSCGPAKDDDNLPIAPLRDWLNEWIEREKRKVRFMAVAGAEKDTDGSGGLPASRVVADALDIESRRLFALRFDQDRVSFSVADRLLTRADRGVRVEDLWPELFIQRDDEGIAA